MAVSAEAVGTLGAEGDGTAGWALDLRDESLGAGAEAIVIEDW